MNLISKIIEALLGLELVHEELEYHLPAKEKWYLRRKGKTEWESEYEESLLDER